MSRVLAMLLVAAATSAAAQGVVPTPTIQLQVLDESGNAIRNGRAEIGALKRWAYVEKGWATIADLPRGTWTVAVRVPGFHPESLAVEAAIGSKAAPVVRLRSTGEVVLEKPDTVTFVPSAQDSTILKEIAERMRVAHGTLLKWDDASVRHAEWATDPLRMARGFRWNTVNTIKTSSGCTTLPRADTLARLGQKHIAIFVDGNRTASAIETVNRMVPARDILAIESYPDMISVPSRWRAIDACAIVAFWTKR